MGYYDNDRDLDRHAMYVEDFLRVLKTPHFRSVQSRVIDPKLQGCEGIEFGCHEYWRCYAREMASTMWHPAGTTAMGAAKDSVLDAQLRVRRTQRLRVVDAGALPTLTSGNINAPVALLAEHAVILIKEEHGITC